MDTGNAALLFGGLIAPFVINFLKRPGWSREAKLWLVMGVSLVIGVLAMLATGKLPNLTLDDPVNTVLTLAGTSTEVVGIATIVYKFFLEKEADVG